MAGYTKNEIIKTVEADAEDMPTFYRQKFVNYWGRTSDTDEAFEALSQQLRMELMEIGGEFYG